MTSSMPNTAWIATEQAARAPVTGRAVIHARKRGDACLAQASAKGRDRHTAHAVVERDAAAIGPRDACGAFALRGLVYWRAGARSRYGCCAWAPLPTLGETHGVWSAIPPSRSAHRRGLSSRDWRLNTVD
jgi:hypothetical protein